MNNRGSLLVQALMLLALFGASVVGFLNLRSGLRTDRQLAAEYHGASAAQTANASILVGCDRYLKGVRLNHTTGTLLKRVVDDFPEERSLTVMAQFAPGAPWASDVAVPLNIHSSTVGGSRFLIHLTVYGEVVPGPDAMEQLQVTDCTVSPYERMYRDGIAEARKNIEYFKSLGVASYAYLGTCLERSYEKFGLQGAIGSYAGAVMMFNTCGKWARETFHGDSRMTTGQIEVVNAYCGFKLTQAANGIPESWGPRMAECLVQSSIMCNPDPEWCGAK